jgi:hypothetical protein
VLVKFRIWPCIKFKNRKQDRRDKRGAVLILVVLVIFISILALAELQIFRTFNQKKDVLLGQYYQRAIAAAISCREAAMARLASDFRYRIDAPTNLNNMLPQINRFSTDPAYSGIFTDIDCQVSVKTVTNPNDLSKINMILANSASSSNPTHLNKISSKDIFVEITASGSSTLPLMFQLKSLQHVLRSIVGISYVYPVIIFTENLTLL